MPEYRSAKAAICQPLALTACAPCCRSPRSSSGLSPRATPGVPADRRRATQARQLPWRHNHRTRPAPGRPTAGLASRPISWPPRRTRSCIRGLQDLRQRAALDVCSSIYIDHCSGSETCLSRGQHLYYMRHVLHLAYAANRVVEITTMTLRRNSFDHGSINNPWRNDVHRHAVRPKFLRQSFPEAYDPRLRGSIVYMSSAAAQPCHRGDEYHAPVLRSPHVGRECLSAQERPCEIYVKHLMPSMRLNLREGLRITDTSTSY
jgi:hypothetical protein